MMSGVRETLTQAHTHTVGRNDRPTGGKAIKRALKCQPGSKVQQGSTEGGKVRHGCAALSVLASVLLAVIASLQLPLLVVY